ncbi:alpha/beta family hydrolase [Aquimonas voraii]|uniref:Predicted hydrolase of the alpha/beta-hydrolase fold n=1 Tax=Aquimonas voraii TaxID=265719 RepID=A0A1G6RYV8_9GAMM|nr:alpha/beta family hydrolase [Aquimonas voraii]SDD09830.1 Predicted hydrolase of the alpha/beta-hydrolase fold [Aquimonas voraii]
MSPRGHVILSHGLESGPQATKVTALAAAAEALGWTSERPDYLDLDATRDVARLPDRLARLLGCCRAALAAGRGPLVLAGSSMGAFISALASLEVDVRGLFLLAPPVRIAGYRDLDAARVPTSILHGWRDELIPAADVVTWAAPRCDELTLVDDSHRLAEHVEYGAQAFARFLERLS